MLLYHHLVAYFINFPYFLNSNDNRENKIRPFQLSPPSSSTELLRQKPEPDISNLFRTIAKTLSIYNLADISNIH